MPVDVASRFDPSAPPTVEFVRQVEMLERLGYPDLIGMSNAAFRTAVEPLAEPLVHLSAQSGVDADDRVPFLLVVREVPAADAARLITRNGKPATLMLSDEELPRFVPTADADVPDTVAYLLVDVDTGSAFCNVSPAEALPAITARRRSPLTVTEGIALVTLRPDMLRKNKCFSLLGSRCGDRRVPAVWISGGAPKLGWCWNAAPHSWLGSASAGSRVG